MAFGVWTFVAALIATGYHPSARASAERAVVACGLAALTASAILIALLLAGTVAVSYVARSIATNVPAIYRAAALLSFPVGAVLPTAAIVAGFGALATRRARSSLGLAAVGATVVALLAASVASTPFATLPWLPADGLGMAPTLQHPASVVGRIALSLAVATGATTAAVAADALGDDARALDRLTYTRWLLATAVWIGATLVLAALGSFATGSASTPAPLALWNGALIPTLVALTCAFRARRGSGEAALLGALGVLGLTSGVLIGAGSLTKAGVILSAFVFASLGSSVYGALDTIIRRQAGVTRLLSVVGLVALAVGAVVAVRAPAPFPDGMPRLAEWLIVGGGVATGLSLGADERGARLTRGLALTLGGAILGAAFGVWLARDAISTAVGWGALAGTSIGVVVWAMHGAARVGASSAGWQLHVCLGGAIAFLALGACGESSSTSSSLVLASGAQGNFVQRLSGSVRLAHQGLSRYERVNSHVMVVAIEASGGQLDRRLITVEQREYVDSRDETLGEPLNRPGVARGPLEELRVFLENSGRGDEVGLRVVSAPLAMAWPLALLALTVTAILAWIPSPVRAALPREGDLVRP